MLRLPLTSIPKLQCSISNAYEMIRGYETEAYYEQSREDDLESDYEQPSDPFEQGYTLHVEFIERYKDNLWEQEARETLKTLFKEANGDFSVINDYIARCEQFFCDHGSLEELAIDVANEMDIKEFKKV